MTQDVFELLKEHYISVARELSSQARQAGILKNPTGVGTEREEVYRTFLERHLPKTCDVFRGGYVFDMQGNVSSQIDVIVASGNAPRFRMPTGESFISPLEGTLAIAEIKSRLDKTSLFDALQKTAVIPLMPASSNIVSPKLRVPNARWNEIPYKMIVAFDAVDKETLHNHITEFYEENIDIPLSRKPNIIHVVEEYFIMRVTPDVQVTNIDGSIPSDQPGVGQYRWFDTGPDALAIAWILNELYANSFIAQNSLFKYDAWINEIADRIRTGNTPQI